MAYNQIPKTDTEAQKILGGFYKNSPENFEAVCSLFKGLNDDSDITIEGPIALQESTKNNVKIARAIKVKYATIGELKKAYKIPAGLKVSFGDGSRGGRGAQNAGSLFEEALDHSTGEILPADLLKQLLK